MIVKLMTAVTILLSVTKICMTYDNRVYYTMPDNMHAV